MGYIAQVVRCRGRRVLVAAQAPESTRPSVSSVCRTKSVAPRRLYRACLRKGQLWLPYPRQGGGQNSPACSLAHNAKLRAGRPRTCSTVGWRVVSSVSPSEKKRKNEST